MGFGEDSKKEKEPLKRKKAKIKGNSNAALIALIIFAAGGVFIFYSYQAILSTAGSYLAPQGSGKADVVILEGSELVKEGAALAGVGMISSGKGKKLIIVYHELDDNLLGRPSPYGAFLAQKLEALGLRREQIEVMEVPEGHPITLNEARVVLASLSGKGIKSAILLAEDFHTRRSYWAYKEVGSGLGIDIAPQPYFARFNSHNWWRQARGIRNFAGESIKFFYYLLRGYLPLKSLVVT